MQISTERAFWILDYYRRFGTKLHLAATIVDEDAASWITITDVGASMTSISVRLFDEAGTESWDRDIALGHVRYFFSQMGDASFVPDCDCHSLLQMEFPDGASLCFTERNRVH